MVEYSTYELDYSNSEISWCVMAELAQRNNKIREFKNKEPAVSKSFLKFFFLEEQKNQSHNK